jgi:calcineurin-like phosphoesterase family protein
MSATWFIADPHFQHEGIIKLCDRPFAGVREMDECLLYSWNAVVRPNDTVIVVGDFAHRGTAGEAKRIFGRLHGKKHLIRGNHDGDDTLNLGWESVRDIACVTVEGERLVLCHYPMLDWPGRHRGALQLYGHTHGRIRGHQQSADIGVDVMGWAPVRISAIKEYMATLPPAPDPEANDLETEVPTP